MDQQMISGRNPIPELLAPAGGISQLRAAVNNGADAVYLGGSRFNARAKADNFRLSDLRDAVRYAHERNVKIYVTLNILLKDRELMDAVEYADSLRCIGADAVIVQDMGLARLLRKYIPELPMHLSTQGTVYNSRAVDLMKRFGFTRIVPARELSLEELKRFSAACHEGDPSCEVEVFVHGALCMCYSGQCQMSRILGSSGGRASARSGNRGLCAQPCRLPYTNDRGETGYFLSPKDLCLLNEIPALCEAGVDSLKIEGRLKSPEYVAVTTGIYRKYLDQYSREGTVRIDPQDMEDLRRIYNRGGFTTGYLYGDPGGRLLSGSSPKHTGVFAGTVKTVITGAKDPKIRSAVKGAARKGAVLIEVDPSGRDPGGRPALSEGDSVEIRPPQKDRPDFARSGGRITYRQELSGGRLRIGDMKGTIRPGDEVWQVTDTALLAAARETYEADDPADLDRRMRRRIPLKMEFEASPGSKAFLRASNGSASAELFSDAAAEEAVNRPSDPRQIRNSLKKLGGTPFTAEDDDISVRLEGSCRLAASEVNRMRRAAVEELLRIKSGTDGLPLSGEIMRQIREELMGAPLPDENVSAEGAAQIPADRVPLESYLEGAEGVPEIFPVSKGRLDRLIESRFSEIAEAVKESGIVIGNAGWILRFLEAGVPVWGGWGLNIFNEQARRAYLEIGVRAAEDSLEKHQPEDGGIPLMITEHPVHTKTLTDRMGAEHAVRRSPSGDKTIIY